jgi:hypothetical protein
MQRSPAFLRKIMKSILQHIADKNRKQEKMETEAIKAEIEKLFQDSGFKFFKIFVERRNFTLNFRNEL